MTDEAPYDKILERARELAAQKRLSGDVPPDLSGMLDRVFLEVAPPGAPARGDGFEALVDVLSRYKFRPEVFVEPPIDGRSRFTFVIKRLLKPIAAWQMRHLTDQLNAYHAALIDLLQEVIKRVEADKES